MYAADMKVYADLLSGENTNEEEIGSVKNRIVLAMRQELTEKQRIYLILYYSKNMNMTEIAEFMKVDKSTVSRTIQRAEQNLRRCLRFGAYDLLFQAGLPVGNGPVNQLSKREGYENC